MTRNIGAYERSIKASAACAHAKASTKQASIEKRSSAVPSGIAGFICGVSEVFAKAAKIKKGISESFVSLTEALADKTAREGLFGEDRDKGYVGTDVDYRD